MSDPKSLLSHGAGFKAHASRVPAVLLVEETGRVRASLASRISRDHGAEVAQAATADEATALTRHRHFEVLIYCNSTWEEGLLLFLDILNRHLSPTQCILFINEQVEIPPEFGEPLRVVRKPHVDALLSAVDWVTPASTRRHSAVSP